MSLEFREIDGHNPDFVKLVRELDAELEARYGALQKQYEPHNRVDHLHDVLIIYRDEAPVACGAFKEYDPETVELKRIFVRPDSRGQGLARMIVSQLFETARLRGYRHALLETGIKQHEAIGLYQSIGFEVIPNYGPYAGHPHSVCMKRTLDPPSSLAT